MNPEVIKRMAEIGHTNILRLLGWKVPKSGRMPGYVINRWIERQQVPADHVPRLGLIINMAPEEIRPDMYRPLEKVSLWVPYNERDKKKAA